MMTAAYRDDLAYIHDAGFGGFAREAGPVLVDALRRAADQRRARDRSGLRQRDSVRAWSRARVSTFWGSISPKAMIALARKHVPRWRVSGRVAPVGRTASLRGRRGCR